MELEHEHWPESGGMVQGLQCLLLFLAVHLIFRKELPFSQSHFFQPGG